MILLKETDNIKEVVEVDSEEVIQVAWEEEAVVLLDLATDREEEANPEEEVSETEVTDRWREDLSVNR